MALPSYPMFLICIVIDFLWFLNNCQAPVHTLSMSTPKVSMVISNSIYIFKSKGLDMELTLIIATYHLPPTMKLFSGHFLPELNFFLWIRRSGHGADSIITTYHPPPTMKLFSGHFLQELNFFFWIRSHDLDHDLDHDLVTLNMVHSSMEKKFR